MEQVRSDGTLERSKTLHMAWIPMVTLDKVAFRGERNAQGQNHTPYDYT